MNKYEQIARDIYNDIASGKYEPGSQLALEKEMCAQYGVSRITVKRAVDELVKQGLVVKRRGSGTFVKGVQEEDVENVGMCGQFGGFSNTHQGHQVSTDVKKFEIVHPSPEVAEKLKISTEDFVYDIIRIRYLDGKPENVEYTQMPIEVIPGIKQEVLMNSIYNHIENTLRLQIQSAHRTVSADMPTEEEKEFLQIEGVLPVLQVAQVAFLSDGRPFEYSKSRHRADTSVFRAVSIH